MLILRLANKEQRVYNQTQSDTQKDQLYPNMISEIAQLANGRVNRYLSSTASVINSQVDEVGLV
jgi:hypothetical protein